MASGSSLKLQLQATGLPKLRLAVLGEVSSQVTTFAAPHSCSTLFPFSVVRC